MMSPRSLSNSGIGLLGIGILYLCQPAPALASDERYYVINEQTSMCLSSPGPGNNVVSVQDNCISKKSRGWLISEVRSGEYQIKNLQTRKCLTIAGGRSTENNVRALQYDCDNDPSRRWRIYSAGGHRIYQLENVQTGKCLTIAGGRNPARGVEALQYNCDDDPSRRWRLANFASPD
jgi:cytolethal distending toxin subunit A